MQTHAPHAELAMPQRLSHGKQLLLQQSFCIVTCMPQEPQAQSLCTCACLAARVCAVTLFKPTSNTDRSTGQLVPFGQAPVCLPTSVKPPLGGLMLMISVSNRLLLPSSPALALASDSAGRCNSAALMTDSMKSGVRWKCDFFCPVFLSSAFRFSCCLMMVSMVSMRELYCAAATVPTYRREVLLL